MNSRTTAWLPAEREGAELSFWFVLCRDQVGRSDRRGGHAEAVTNTPNGLDLAAKRPEFLAQLFDVHVYRSITDQVADTSLDELGARERPAGFRDQHRQYPKLRRSHWHVLFPDVDL